MANKDPYSQSCGFFPVVIYGCESWTIKNPDPGKDRRQEEKGMTEDETIGRYH